MTYNPQTLKDLGAYWTAQGGVNLGVVGNKAHTKGYHLGRDRIYDGSGPGLGNADYSVQLTRDRNGLTDAASAIDLGKLDGSLEELRKFSVDLVARCMADPDTRRDIREIIYSPDGAKVQRWSGVDNEIHTGPGNGDLSHLHHTHISFFRDSEGRDKRPAFAPYFAPPAEPAPPEEEDMDIYSSPGLVSVTLPKDAPLFDRPGGAVVVRTTDPTRRYDVMGQDKAADPEYLLVDDRSVPSTVMRWAKASYARDERSTPDGFFNQGVDAAAAAALTAKRT